MQPMKELRDALNHSYDLVRRAIHEAVETGDNRGARDLIAACERITFARHSVERSAHRFMVCERSFTD